MFKKGMKVIKTFKGIGGYRETSEAIVGKVSKKANTVWLANEGSPGDLEWGVTYDLKGRERERERELLSWGHYNDTASKY